MKKRCKKGVKGCPFPDDPKGNHGQCPYGISLAEEKEDYIMNCISYDEVEYCMIGGKKTDNEKEPLTEEEFKGLLWEHFQAVMADIIEQEKEND